MYTIERQDVASLSLRPVESLVKNAPSMAMEERLAAD